MAAPEEPLTGVEVLLTGAEVIDRTYARLKEDYQLGGYVLFSPPIEIGVERNPPFLGGKEVRLWYDGCFLGSFPKFWTLARGEAADPQQELQREIAAIPLQVRLPVESYPGYLTEYIHDDLYSSVVTAGTSGHLQFPSSLSSRVALLLREQGWETASIPQRGEGMSYRSSVVDSLVSSIARVLNRELLFP